MEAHKAPRQLPESSPCGRALCRFLVVPMLRANSQSGKGETFGTEPDSRRLCVCNLPITFRR
jgi:hypothetical protein